jgi:hypothetical protein
MTQLDSEQRGGREQQGEILSQSSEENEDHAGKSPSMIGYVPYSS